MNKQKKDFILTLDNGNKYVLTNTLEKNLKKYVCLINIEDYSDMIFGEIVNNQITTIENSKLLIEIINAFNEINKSQQ